MNSHTRKSILFLLFWTSAIFFAVAALAQQPARALSEPVPPPQLTITLAPPTETNTVGTTHTVTATVLNNSQPLADQTIKFLVSGKNIVEGNAPTNANGQAAFTYTGTIPGEDTITAWIDKNHNGLPDPAELSDIATQILVAEWRDICATERMEINGVGMGDSSYTLDPQTLAPDDPAGVTWLLAQLAGRRSYNAPVPETVTFTTNNGETVTLSEPSRDNQPGYTFEGTILQPTEQVTISINNIIGGNSTGGGGSDFKTPRGFMLYAKQDTGSERWTSVGRTTNEYVHWSSREAYTEVLTFPPLTRTTDLSVTAVVIDNNDDNRPLVLTATDGHGLTVTETVTGLSHGALLNIIELTLPQVPAGSEQVNVTLQSPPEDDGDSLVLAGVNVSYPCSRTMEEVDLAVSDTVVTQTIGSGLNKQMLITYTITVTNNGSGTANSVSLTDTFSTDLTYGGYITSHGVFTFNNSTRIGTWYDFGLSGHMTATLMITATMGKCEGGGNIPNRAVVAAIGQTELITDNNEARVDFVGGTGYCIYLPIILKKPTVCEEYDFNISPDGWPEEDEDEVQTGYTDNKEEFFINRDIFGFRLAQAPVDYSNRYTVEVDITWDDVGYEYGLIFGQSAFPVPTYAFGIGPDPEDPHHYRYRLYRILTYDSNNHTITMNCITENCWITSVLPAQINNHLKVECQDESIKLYVNNIPLPEINGENMVYPCDGHIGVFAQSSPSDPNALAYFDNFRLTCPVQLGQQISPNCNTTKSLTNALSMELDWIK